MPSPTVPATLTAVLRARARAYLSVAVAALASPILAAMVAATARAVLSAGTRVFQDAKQKAMDENYFEYNTTKGKVRCCLWRQLCCLWRQRYAICGGSAAIYGRGRTRG
eukprot:3028589-Rhodomonas_salina.4